MKVKEDIIQVVIHRNIGGDSMRVLITGVTGFIGSRVVEEIAKIGEDVYGIVRHISSTRHLPDRVKPVIADLTDKQSIEKAVKLVRPDIVMHIGALTPVSLSYDMPIAYAEVNYHGTVFLAEACIKYAENLKAFIYASTSEVYGQQSTFPLHEDLPAYPNTPYAISKYAGELYVRKYMVEAYDFPAFALRPFNTYGRALVNQRHFVVEKLITSMLEGSKVIMMGSPDPVRDLMFREDHVRAYIDAFYTALTDIDNVKGEVINIATGRGYTIKKVAEIIADKIGWDGEIVWDFIIRPADIHKLVGSNSKAKRLLGWKPEYSLDKGLDVAIDEWRAFL